NSREHVQQHVDTFAGNTTTNVQKLRSRFPAGKQIVGCSVFGWLWQKRLGQAIGRLHQSVHVQKPVAFDLLSDVARRVEDNCRFLESPQNVPCHRLEPARAWLALRFDEAAKQVQIMAENPSALRRQGVDQVGIAVITKVEQVELADSPAQVAWIIP